MFTPEQEKFLAQFADNEIQKQKEEEKRIAESQAESDRFIARTEFLDQLKITKEAELQQAIQEYDASVK